jgi:hypothetical protein
MTFVVLSLGQAVSFSLAAPASRPAGDAWAEDLHITVVFYPPVGAKACVYPCRQTAPANPAPATMQRPAQSSGSSGFPSLSIEIFCGMAT